MAGLPTADEAFGPARVPTADEAFGPKPVSVNELALGGADMDEYFSQGSAGRILDLFGQGFKDGWGAEPLGLPKETVDALRKAGVFNDYEAGHTSLWKQFNESLMRGTAIGADAALRTIGGVVRGISEPLVAGGLPRDLTPQAFMEAFPAGHLTGFPSAPHLGPLEKARELNVIGPSEDAAARQALSPTGVERPNERVLTPRTEPAAAVEPTEAAVTEAAQPPGPDLHAIARQIEPELFAEYDALSARRDVLSDQLAHQRELRRAGSSPELERADQEIAALERAGLAAEAAKARNRRAGIAKRLEEGTGDTEAMQELQRSIQETDYAMRDMAPEVSVAYRRADDVANGRAELAPPEPEAPAVAGEPVVEQPVEPVPVESSAASESPTQQALPLNHTRPPAEPVTEGAVPPTGEPAATEAAPSAPAVETPAPAPSVSVVRSLEGGIAGDVSRQLTAAGRPAEEANAAAALVQAHYEARAARFNGELGTAEDLYRRDAPEVRAARAAPVREPEMAQRQIRRGKIKLATDDAGATITLMRDADASTFIHETGHQWLEELVADAADERAPVDLTKDAQTVRDWLGVKEGEAIPTKAHEKFARGFERYMMEGHAPSQALADVFAKFRDWLTRIYETVTRLRSPITDDIRGVFDRMIATEGERAVIAPREPPREFVTGPAADKGGAYVRVPREPMRLVDFIKKNGGLRDDTFSRRINTERGRADAKANQTEIRGIAEHPRAKGLIKARTGLAHDEAALRAWEEGYFPEMTERPTVDDLYNAIREDLNGTPRYAAGDDAAVNGYNEAIARNREVDRIADVLGINPREMIREQFWDRAAEQLSREEQAREIGALDAEHELQLREAEKRAKEWLESRGDSWEPDAVYGNVPRSLEDLERAYQSEAEAARGPSEGAGGPVESGSPAADTRSIQGSVRQGGRGAGPSGRTGAGAGEAPLGPHDTFGPVDGRLVDKAGNIRIDNLNVPEDVAAAIRESSAENGDFMAARRGVLSDAETLALADDLGLDPATLNRRKIGEAFNAEQVIAARKLLIQSATDVRDAMVRAATGSDADVVAYGTAKARHLMIQEQVAGITAEAGRALRAFRAIEGSKDAAALGDFLQNNTGRTLNQMRKEAQLGLKLETPEQIAKFVRDTEKPTWKDYVTEAWLNALLSGPITHVKNMIGNLAVALNSVAETGGAAAIGAAREAVAGQPVDRVRFPEVEARIFGIVKGAQEGLIAAGKAMRDENFSSTEAHTVERTYHRQAIPSAKINVGGYEMEVGGKQVRLPSRFLAAEDEFFKAIAARQELNAIAYRMAADEGLVDDAFNTRVAKLLENPDEAMVEQARKHAEYQTFVRPLGPAGRALQQMANTHFALKVALPFIRTPVNILKYATERTPAGLLMKEVQENLSGKNGAIARDTQIARMAIGTMVATAAVGFAAEGLLTGGGPSDQAQKAALRLSGWQPYSVKIGDMYYSHDWFDPFGTIMGVAADMTEAVKAGFADDAELDKIAAMAVASISKNILQKASLKGASDLVQALTDPDRYGPKYLQNLVGSLVPAFLAQPARAEDPVQRDIRTTLDAIKSRIPGLREGLMPKRDIWGEPMPNQGSLGPDLLSPIRESAVNNDPVNRALNQLKFAPAPADRKIQGVELTPQQYDDYARVGGRMAKMQLDAIIGPVFTQMPVEMQRKIISDTVSHARQAAAAQVMMQSVGTANDIVAKATGARLEALQGATHEHVKQLLKVH